MHINTRNNTHFSIYLFREVNDKIIKYFILIPLLTLASTAESNHEIWNEKVGIAVDSQSRSHLCYENRSLSVCSHQQIEVH